MLLVRNLIQQAYTDAGIVGQGMTLTSEQMSTGLDSLNSILDDIYASQVEMPAVAFRVTLPSTSTVTIGPAPADPLTEPVPDIEVSVSPFDIKSISLNIEGTRIICPRATSAEYFSRDLDSITSEYPRAFYYELTSPLATIRFLDGTPTGTAELLITPSMVDVGLNVDLDYHPRALRPFLKWELAAVVAEQNTFESNSLRARALGAWKRYQASAYQGQEYAADSSAPGRCRGRFNIYSGE